MKCEIERMEINYTFYFFAFLKKVIKKLLTFCYWVDRLAQSYQHFINKYCGGNKNIVLDQICLLYTSPSPRDA